MNKKKLLQRIIKNQNNIKFNDVVILMEALGFSLDRINGSHHIFKHQDIPVLINIQRVKDEAKPYQIRQLLKLIEKHNVELKD